MSLADSPRSDREHAGNGACAPEASVSSSIEHLVVSSQGVITKRLDLALLEGQEMLSRASERAALGGVAMLLAAGAWFAGARALVSFLAPDASPARGMAAFGLLNAAGATAFVVLAARRGARASRPLPGTNDTTSMREASRIDGRR